MHDSIGVIQIGPSDEHLGANDALEELIAPWPSVRAWWNDVRDHLESLPRTECTSCGDLELNDTFRLELTTPGGEPVNFRISFHGHTHGEASDTPQTGVTVGTVERGATGVPKPDEMEGLTRLSEASVPEQFDALGLNSAATREGLSEAATPSKNALAYIHRKHS